jgi:hypothetical protein
VADSVGRTEVDLWINEETGLPRRFVLNMEMTLPGVGDLENHMTMEFETFNEPVDIPPEPVGARPFSEFLGN